MAFYAVASYIVAVTLLRGRRLAVEERRGPAWRRRWYPAGLAISAAAIVLLVGVTRVYLGVHYPSDVVGGFLAGGAWALFCLAWFERLRHGL
jgi:membrane-associated phospholipid phosphatase